MSQLVMTPVGTVSVFGFKTPVPYPFGLERTGYLVTDVGEAIPHCQNDWRRRLIAAFNDPIGQDAIIQWPGWREHATDCTALRRASPAPDSPENRA